MKELEGSLSVWQATRCWLKAVWVTVLGRDLDRPDHAMHGGAVRRTAGAARLPLLAQEEAGARYLTTVMADGTVVHGVTLPFDTLSPLFTDTVLEYVSTRPLDTRPSELSQAA